MLENCACGRDVGSAIYAENGLKVKVIITAAALDYENSKKYGEVMKYFARWSRHDGSWKLS